MLQQTVTELFWQSFARLLKIKCTEAAIKIDDNQVVRSRKPGSKTT